MAAEKIHLRNVDKSYKLKKTDEVTSAGRPVYLNTKTGEKHSEISITIEYPEGSGNWINVPSLINGRVYNVQGVLDMLEAGKITPNSTGHLTQDAAVEAAIYRSNNLQSNIGETLKPANEVVDYDPVKAAFVNENMNTFASTFPNMNDNPNGLFNVESALNQQILGTDQASMEEVAANNLRLKELAAMTKEANMSSRHPEGKGYWARIFDLDRLNKKFRLPLNPDAQHIRDATGYPEEKRRPYPSGNLAVGSGIPALRGEALAEPSVQEAEAMQRAYFGPGTTKGTKAYPLDGKKWRARGQLREENLFRQGAGAMQYAQGDNITPPKGSGISTLRGMELAESRFNEDADVMQPYQREYKSSKIKGSGIPVLRGEEKAEKLMSKNAKPNYEEIPGFKFHDAGFKKPDGTAAGYYSADETSPFWQTNAGYDKAMQTWGEKPGWVKPGYRPKRKELDIEAIKKLFRPNR